MPSGGAGIPRATRSYSGMGRFPNNVDAMRKAAGVIYKDLVVPLKRGGVGISGSQFMALVKGETPLPDAVAARLAHRFKCSIDDLRWKGTDEKRQIVPYKAPKTPATRGRPPKAPIERPSLPKREPIELTIAVGGRLIGGVTMFDPKAMRRVIRDAFGEDDVE